MTSYYLTPDGDSVGYESADELPTFYGLHIEGSGLLIGGRHDDRLNGWMSDDTFDGGAGNDRLRGDGGADTYRFGRGSGRDVVDATDLRSEDKNISWVEMKAGVALRDLVFTRDGNNLVIAIAGTPDTLTISDHYLPWDPQEFTGGIAGVRLADGTTIDEADIIRLFGLDGLGYDTSFGSEGNDTLLGSNYDGDSLGGGAGNDVLDGGANPADAKDVLRGGEGNDRLVRGEENFGGLGSDTYELDGAGGLQTVTEDNTAAAAGDTDIIELSAAFTRSNTVFRMDAANGDLMIARGDGSLVAKVTQFYRTDVNSVETFRFSDGTFLTRNELLAQVLQVSSGNDTINGVFNSTSLVIDAREGNDTLIGGSGNDTLLGGEGSDSLEGMAGNDVLDGGTNVANAKDVLRGGEGNDRLVRGEENFGGLGSDTYALDGAGGLQTVTEDNTAAAAGDTDIIELSAAFTRSNTVFRMDAATGDLTVALRDGNLAAKVTQFYRTDVNSVETFRFSDGTFLTRNELLAQVLQVSSGNDTVNGAFNTSSLVINAREGNDTLIGGSAADTLDGGAGNDELNGGRGDDTYLFSANSGYDSISESADPSGTDTVRLAAGITPQMVTLFRDRSSYMESRNDLFIVINGSATQLRVEGFFDKYDNSQAADTRIERIAFADGTIWTLNTIESRVQRGVADTQRGTAAYNAFVVDHADDVIIEGINQGIDVVRASVTLNGPLAANVENLELTGAVAINGYGNGLNNSIAGNLAANWILGGEGNDALSGNGGDDKLEGEAGNDTLDGGTGDDLLLDHSGNNTLTGGAGNDRLEVMAGSLSTMRGGLGDDTYRVIGSTLAGSSARAIENGGEGYDTVEIVDVASYVLSENIERLNVLSHSGPSTYVVGNSLDNIIIDSDGQTGSGSAITLDGGAGNDTLNGMGGNDTLAGGAGNDVYVFGRGSGVDRINDYDLTAGNTDVLSIGPDVAVDQLWLRRVGTDLELSIIGTSDKAIVSNWFQGDGHHVEQIRTSDGMVMLHSQVDALVSAMAGFAPPAPGQMTFVANHQSALFPVIGANRA